MDLRTFLFVGRDWSEIFEALFSVVGTATARDSEMRARVMAATPMRVRIFETQN